MIPRMPRWQSYVATTTQPIFTPEQCKMIIDAGHQCAPEQAKVGGGEEGKYVEAFWLIPVEGRAEIFDAFAKQNDLRLGSPYRINGVEYIRIQNRKTLNALLMMVPPCLIDANQRVKAFVEVMQMINSREHLTQEGRDKIELLKQKMHKWYSKDSEHYAGRQRWEGGWKRWKQ